MILDSSGNPIRPRLDNEYGEPIEYDSDLPPHAFRFASVWNSFSKIYSYRSDEALRDNVGNAKAMPRDAYITSLLNERRFPTCQFEWQIDPEDKTRSDLQEGADILKRAIEMTPSWQDFLFVLLEAIWYGRYGVQMRPGRRGDLIRVESWSPVHGDKIQFSHEGTPLIYVNPAFLGNYPSEYIRYTDRVPGLLLARRAWREQFIIHKHLTLDADYFDGEMAGRIHGVGLRDQVYWCWLMRDELLGWALDYLQKLGTLGLLIFWYDASNPDSRKRAEENAKNASRRSALIMPRPPGSEKNGHAPGVEQLRMDQSGAAQLQGMIKEYFESHIERLIIGQTLSAGTEGSGLGGSGVAYLHADTKYRIIRFDASKLESTLNNDFVPYLCRRNGLDDEAYKIKFSIPDPTGEPKLRAAQMVWSMGVDLGADELRDLAGLRKPEPDEPVVNALKQQQQQAGQEQGQGSPPQPPDQRFGQQWDLDGEFMPTKPAVMPPKRRMEDPSLEPPIGFTADAGGKTVVYTGEGRWVTLYAPPPESRGAVAPPAPKNAVKEPPNPTPKKTAAELMADVTTPRPMTKDAIFGSGGYLGYTPPVFAPEIDPQLKDMIAKRYGRQSNYAENNQSQPPSPKPVQSPTVGNSPIRKAPLARPPIGGGASSPRPQQPGWQPQPSRAEAMRRQALDESMADFHADARSRMGIGPGVGPATVGEKRDAKLGPIHPTPIEGWPERTGSELIFAPSEGEVQRRWAQFNPAFPNAVQPNEMARDWAEIRALTTPEIMASAEGPKGALQIVKDALQTAGISLASFPGLGPNPSEEELRQALAKVPLPSSYENPGEFNNAWYQYLWNSRRSASPSLPDTFSGYVEDQANVFWRMSQDEGFVRSFHDGLGSEGVVPEMVVGWMPRYLRSRMESNDYRPIETAQAVDLRLPYDGKMTVVHTAVPNFGSVAVHQTPTFKGTTAAEKETRFYAERGDLIPRLMESQVARYVEHGITAMLFLAPEMDEGPDALTMFERLPFYGFDAPLPVDVKPAAVEMSRGDLERFPWDEIATVQDLVASVEGRRIWKAYCHYMRNAAEQPPLYYLQLDLLPGSRGLEAFYRGMADNHGADAFQKSYADPEPFETDDGEIEFGDEAPEIDEADLDGDWIDTATTYAEPSAEIDSPQSPGQKPRQKPHRSPQPNPFDGQASPTRNPRELSPPNPLPPMPGQGGFDLDPSPATSAQAAAPRPAAPGPAGPQGEDPPADPRISEPNLAPDEDEEEWIEPLSPAVIRRRAELDGEIEQVLSGVVKGVADIKKIYDFLPLASVKVTDIYDGRVHRGRREVSYMVRSPEIAICAREIGFSDEGGSPVTYVKHDHLELKKTKRGSDFGIKFFAGQVSSYLGLGLDEVRTMAARLDGDTGRGQTMNGYYVWPLFGFDAEIPSWMVEGMMESVRRWDGQVKISGRGLKSMKTARGGLSKRKYVDLIRERIQLPYQSEADVPKTLLELTSTPEGRLVWSLEGVGTYCRFDLRPGSASIRRLNAYLQSKGRPLIAEQEPGEFVKGEPRKVGFGESRAGLLGLKQMRPLDASAKSQMEWFKSAGQDGDIWFHGRRFTFRADERIPETVGEFIRQFWQRGARELAEANTHAFGEYAIAERFDSYANPKAKKAPGVASEPPTIEAPAEAESKPAPVSKPTKPPKRSPEPPASAPKPVKAPRAGAGASPREIESPEPIPPLIDSPATRAKPSEAAKTQSSPRLKESPVASMSILDSEGVPQLAAEIRSLLGNKKGSNADVAEALVRDAQRRGGVVKASDMIDRDRNLVPEYQQVYEDIRDTMQAEVVAELARSKRTGATSGAAWYTAAIEKAKAFAKVALAELNVGKEGDKAMKRLMALGIFGKPGAKVSEARAEAETVLFSALAITSQGINVAANTKFAMEQYAHYRKHGEFDLKAKYGKSASAIRGNLELLQDVISASREEGIGLEDFLKRKYTKKKLQAIMAEFGAKKTINARAEDEVYYANIFGPKIGGGFLMNLLGVHDPVTIDLWMRRTFGRYTGDAQKGKLNEKNLGRLMAYAFGREREKFGKAYRDRLRAEYGADAAKRFGLLPELPEPPKVLKRTMFGWELSKGDKGYGKRGNELVAIGKAAKAIHDQVAVGGPSFVKTVNEWAVAVNSRWDALFEPINTLPVTPEEFEFLAAESAGARERAKAFKKDADPEEAGKPNRFYAGFDHSEAMEGALEAVALRVANRRKAAVLKYHEQYEWEYKIEAEEALAVGKKPPKKLGLDGYVLREMSKDGAMRLSKWTDDSKGVLNSLKPEWAKAAKVVAEILDPQGAPSPADRTVIVRLVNEVRERLASDPEFAKEFPDAAEMANADVQAILWYPEKDIWNRLLGKPESKLKLSYDWAMERFKMAVEKGVIDPDTMQIREGAIDSDTGLPFVLFDNETLAEEVADPEQEEEETQ
jgi:hypothetical protein